MKIAVGADHGGFELKEHVVAWLVDHGYGVEDCGTYDGEVSVDYPEFGRLVAKKVTGGECDLGVLVCGTGIGISIAANKVRGIRCSLCHDTFSAKMARQHNDANVLAMGARVIGRGLALEILEAWLGHGFEGGRHQRRVDLIGDMERD